MKKKHVCIKFEINGDIDPRFFALKIAMKASDSKIIKPGDKVRHAKQTYVAMPYPNKGSTPVAMERSPVVKAFLKESKKNGRN